MVGRCRDCGEECDDVIRYEGGLYCVDCADSLLTYEEEIATQVFDGYEARLMNDRLNHLGSAGDSDEDDDLEPDEDDECDKECEDGG